MLACAMMRPASGDAQVGDVFAKPWTGVDGAEFLDDAYIAHLAASRTAEFEHLRERVMQECRAALNQSMRRADVRARALRASDVVMSQLRASTFSRFSPEDLTASRRTGMVDRFGGMTYGQSMMLHTGLGLEQRMQPPAGTRSPGFGGETEPVPYDCQ